MAEQVTYVVVRAHLGDRQYHAGETRMLAAADAKHLVMLGVLRKAETVPEDAAAATPIKASTARAKKD